MFHRNRPLFCLGSATSSFCPMAAGHTLHVALILDSHATRTDFNGPLDFCNWFPLYGPLCSGVRILVFGSASKAPLKMKLHHDTLQSMCQLYGVLRHPPTHLPVCNFRQAVCIHCNYLDPDCVFCLQHHQDRSHTSMWSSSYLVCLKNIKMQDLDPSIYLLQ